MCRHQFLLRHVVCETRSLHVLWNGLQDAKQRADAAAHRAAEYLSTKIMQVTDPFQMAILTYALQVSHHKERDTAYNRLRPMGHLHDTSTCKKFVISNDNDRESWMRVVRFWCRFTQVNLDLRAVKQVCSLALLAVCPCSLVVTILTVTGPVITILFRSVCLY